MRDFQTLETRVIRFIVNPLDLDTFGDAQTLTRRSHRHTERHISAIVRAHTVLFICVSIIRNSLTHSMSELKAVVRDERTSCDSDGSPSTEARRIVWSRLRVERQTRERASGTNSQHNLPKLSGFVFGTFTVNARLNKIARTRVCVCSEIFSFTSILYNKITSLLISSAKCTALEAMHRFLLNFFAPFDFHLFGPLKKTLRGRRYTNDEQIKEMVHTWLRRIRRLV